MRLALLGWYFNLFDEEREGLGSYSFLVLFFVLRDNKVSPLYSIKAQLVFMNKTSQQ